MEKSWKQWATSEATPQLAQTLLGAKLQVGDCSGLIVEVEAYLGINDEAAHTFNGRHTLRNAALWGPPGTIYVYQMRQYCLLNLNVQATGVPDCLLIRAMQPQTGLKIMESRRRQQGVSIANGPGKLCQALGITRADSGSTLDDSRIHLQLHVRTPAHIASGPRIGIPNAGAATNWPLRFWVANNPYVSGSSRRAGALHQEGWQHGTT